jgi:hypothetical protein
VFLIVILEHVFGENSNIGVLVACKNKAPTLKSELVHEKAGAVTEQSAKPWIWALSHPWLLAPLELAALLPSRVQTARIWLLD